MGGGCGGKAEGSPCFLDVTFVCTPAPLRCRANANAAATAAGDAAGFDPSLVSVSGTVEGGVYKHRAAHFEWLVDVGSSLGLSFEEMGKRRHGPCGSTAY